MIDLTKKPVSSFLSCEKDMETILYRLFIENKVWGEQLKRLLIINEKDCLDNLSSKVYKDILDEMTIAKMVEKGYIRVTPKLELPEHEEVKAYMLISFDNFTLSGNPQFRDCTIKFDIICHTDCWSLGNYRLRPLKIVGYIDGILNNSKLSGIGELEFADCHELVLDKNLSGYTLVYYAVHGSDDIIPGDE